MLSNKIISNDDPKVQLTTFLSCANSKEDTVFKALRIPKDVIHNISLHFFAVTATSKYKENKYIQSLTNSLIQVCHTYKQNYLFFHNVHEKIADKFMIGLDLIVKQTLSEHKKFMFIAYHLNGFCDYLIHSESKKLLKAVTKCLDEYAWFVDRYYSCGYKDPMFQGEDFQSVCTFISQVKCLNRLAFFEVICGSVTNDVYLQKLNEYYVESTMWWGEKHMKHMKDYDLELELEFKDFCNWYYSNQPQVIKKANNNITL